MTPLRVLYFTIVDVSRVDNGGGLICRHHIRQLACTDGVVLTVCTAGASAQRGDEKAFVASVGAVFRFVPFRDSSVSPPPSRWPFMYEALASAQAHVNTEVAGLVRQVRPDVIVIDYVPTALFARSLYADRVPVITITLNAEARFYRDLRRLGRVPADASASWAANLRAACFERWVYRKSRAVVALTDRDLAAVPFWRTSAVMPPLFSPVEQRWLPEGREHVFFVGNMGHYPNALAIEWLATRLGPSLESLGSAARLRILGAGMDSVPSHWLHANLDYLGVGEKSAVDNEFVKSDLFIAPIANPFGSKMKVLECLAHGTPLAATREALTGLPSLRGVPTFRLDRPRSAAHMIIGLLRNPDGLRVLSRRTTEHLVRQIEEQHGRWGSLLQKVARMRRYG